MTSTVEKHEERAAKKDVPARERYKSRREDRKPGLEEIETMRTDELFTKRSDSAMAVRTCSLVVDPRLPESALFSQISGVCKALLRKWADVDDSKISVSKITGGITNMLLKAEVEGENESELVPVTVRVFGPNTDAVIDRDRELQALTYLSSAGFGAKLLGVFGNGMIQSFIVGRTLEPLDMGKPELAKLIAVEVRRLHGLEIPGSKEPLLWKDIYKFIDKASSVTFEDSEKQKTYETISFDEVRAEVEELRAISDRFNAPIVFAHNDLLSGNFMYNEDEGKLYIIDYEYGSHSYRGYDIANYFNEHAGFDCDYSLYPVKEKQFFFFRHYLHPENPEMSTETELEEFYAECNFYSLASHMYWATWAIVQARYSPIDFDYLEYFFLRYDEYKRRKEEMLPTLRYNILVLPIVMKVSTERRFHLGMIWSVASNPRHGHRLLGWFNQHWILALLDSAKTNESFFWGLARSRNLELSICIPQERTKERASARNEDHQQKASST